MSAREANFDGLPGPTHHYAGLSFGNEASMRHRHRLSNPALAARQGLLKMKALADAGFIQGVLPPHERPNLPLLRRLGWRGRDEEILAAVCRQTPALLEAVSSASAMWVANAATVAPSADTLDRRVHLTVANLNSKFHRASEAQTTEHVLRAIFRDDKYFAVHAALPQTTWFADEGAANHSRLCARYGDAGLHLFIYGREQGGTETARYPARQTLEASQAVARLNQLPPERTLFARQNPAVIDAGVFHNDVIAVANRQLLFCHELAFLDAARLYAQLREKVAGFSLIEVPERDISVTDAVQTYLFNSQLLSKPGGDMTLLLPQEAYRHSGVWRWLNGLLAADNPITSLEVFDLRESMANGGGPACLRLRVVLSEEEKQALNPAVLMDDTLFATLNRWVDRWYRDRLVADDLRDPQLLAESRGALDELTQILQLGSLYPFQREGA